MRRQGPATKEELRQSLDEIIQQAYNNGVDLNDGAYPLQHDDPDTPDFELMLFQLKS